MDIEYNGVLLEMLEMVECSRDAVYDASGTDLLYIRWRIGVIATLGSGGYPHATAVDFANKGNTLLNVTTDLTGSGALVDRDGVIGRDPNQYAWDAVKQSHAVHPGEQRNQAFITDHELRMRLMQPRKRLKITAYNPNGLKYIWLESPRPLSNEPQLNSRPARFDPSQDQQGLQVDANNGPKPLKCDIVQPAGEGNTFGVHFVIETCTVPAPTHSERLVLSHRWESQHTHDDDHYLTRVVHGTVRFNGSILQNGDQQPDWYRSQFFHPIPLGFRRTIPDVKLSEDGLVLTYTIVDTDPTVTFDPGDSGATQITIAENLNYLNRSMMSIAKSLGQSLLKSLSLFPKG